MLQAVHEVRLALGRRIDAGGERGRVVGAGRRRLLRVRVGRVLGDVLAALVLRLLDRGASRGRGRTLPRRRQLPGSVRALGPEVHEDQEDGEGRDHPHRAPAHDALAADLLGHVGKCDVEER